MKLLKAMGWATVAAAIGWVIGGVLALISLYRVLAVWEQADLDDDEGGFMPQSVLARHRQYRSN